MIVVIGSSYVFVYGSNRKVAPYFYAQKSEKCAFRLHRGQKEKFLNIIPFKSQLADQRIVKK